MQVPAANINVCARVCCENTNKTYVISLYNIIHYKLLHENYGFVNILKYIFYNLIKKFSALNQFKRRLKKCFSNASARKGTPSPVNVHIFTAFNEYLTPI